MNIGDKIDHDDFGIGIISEVSITSFKVIFKVGGEREFSKSNSNYEVVETVAAANEGSSGSGVNLDEVEKLLSYVLDKYNGIEHTVDLGEKWTGGTMVLNPGREDLKSKEIPIEIFFHKIVMLRDRLRVLEQNINSHNALSDEDKVNLQQYITRCYGSLTTFNVLFDDKEDYFIGESKKRQ